LLESTSIFILFADPLAPSVLIEVVSASTFLAGLPFRSPVPAIELILPPTGNSFILYP
jgi:hypothetical protein